MGDLILVLVSIASIGGTLTAFGLALRHHAALMLHEILPPAENDITE